MNARLITLTLTLAMIGAASAGAQEARGDQADSRAQNAIDQRNDKRETITPPRRSAVERALYWYDVNGAKAQWRFVHLSGGSFPGGAGFGYGVGATKQAVGSKIVDPAAPNRVDVDFAAARTVRGYQRVSARIDFLNLLGAPIDFTVRGQDYRLTQEDFYGIGQHSLEADRTNYRHDGQEYEAALTWRPLQAWHFGGAVFYLNPQIKPGNDRAYPPTQLTFHDVPGLSGLPAFIRGDASASFDWRDSATHPRRGGEYRATLSQYAGIDNAAFDFRRLDVGVQQIIPLFDRYRRVELRGGLTLTDASADASVPFIYQPVLGGSATLRSFHGMRFRDQNAVWGRAEYQWESWWAMDTALFIDAGQVASTRTGFAADDVAYSYGIGFRVHSNSKFLARLDLAYGREGVLPSFGFKYGF
jgi:hypothetical protein